jgi:hypothetical protein
VITASFDPVLGGLNYEMRDSSGSLIERIEKYFPVPPEPQCEKVVASDLEMSLSEA